MPGSTIEIENISHSYGATTALRGVSFSIREGERFALLGPNGGGKTTLFHLISTLLTSQSGTIRVGDVCTKENPHGVREQLGVVFQNPSLDKKLTVRENLIFHGRLYGLAAGEIETRAAPLLETFQLKERLHETVENLSGGFKRRVELTKVLLIRPRLLLMDEPTNGLDPGARREWWEAVSQLNQTMGLTVLYTTHLFEEADHAHRVALLHEGKLAACGTPDSLKNEAGGLRLRVLSDAPQRVCEVLGSQPKLKAETLGEQVAIRGFQSEEEAATVMADLFRKLPDIEITCTLARATLADLFFLKTGTRWEEK